MPSNLTYKTRNIIIIFSIIVISAVLFGIAFQQYYISISNEIIELAAQDIRSNLEIETHDISKILEADVDSISNSLLLLTNATNIENKTRAEVYPLLEAAGMSNNLTDFYIWIDNGGELVWISNMNQSTNENLKGTDFSKNEYFYIPKQTQRPHYSSIIDSNDKTPRLYISHPIITNGISNEIMNRYNNTSDTASTISPLPSMPESKLNSTIQHNQEFNGVVAAAIRFDTIGRLLQDIVPSKYNLSVGFIDRDGVILYSRNKSFIGMNVFEEGLQSTVPYYLRESFNRLVSQSLTSNIDNDMPNIQDLTDMDGNTTSVGYQPISFRDHRIGTLYVMAPHNLAESVEIFTNQLKTLGTIIYIVIGSIAIGIAYAFLIWNKNLYTQVKKRTIELNRSNERLHAANEELKKNDAIQTQFINTAAHELRTPIQSIVGYMELLQTSSDWDKLKNTFENDSLDSLEAISRNAIRLQDLANDILDVTRIDSGTLKLNKGRIFIREKLKSIIVDVINSSSKIKEKEIQMLFDESKLMNLDSHALFIEVDKSRLQQVLANLINNSAQFSDNRGLITIFLESYYNDVRINAECDNREENNRNESMVTNELIIRIKDRGEGIDSGIQPRLFTKFASAFERGGTGLGLYISKNIITAFGGKIWAENNSDGKGAIFSFSLPLRS
jgi:signal transduction histidine kinase